MAVMAHAYDALGKLGGTGTTMMLGDWSKSPAWLFPHMPGFQGAFGPWYTLPATSAPALAAPAKTAQGGEGPGAGGGNPYGG